MSEYKISSVVDITIETCINMVLAIKLKKMVPWGHYIQ